MGTLLFRQYCPTKNLYYADHFSKVVSQEERDFAVCDNWGSFFSDSIDGVLVETYFSEVVRKYSDLVVPLLDYLAGKFISELHKQFMSNHVQVVQAYTTTIC